MAKLKYNNMIATKEWAKQDPKDAVIAALTTRINKLEGGNPKAKGTNPQPNPRNNQPEESVPGCSTLAKWCTETKGDKITRNGKEWHWCPHHKLEGKYNGLYMPHDPNESHKKWAAKKAE